MVQKTGGQALVDALIAQGVDTIFGLPGIQMDGFFNALHDAGSAIRVIATRHEQAAAYMAFGYAEATGRPGVYAVVPGPGVLNTTAALATAYGCNTPVLCLSGQIASHHLGRGLGMLHEIPDQLGILQRLTKHAAAMLHPSEADSAVASAFAAMQSGRRRPAALEIPLDVLHARCDVAPPDNQSAAIWQPAIDGPAVEAAAAVLNQAKRPIIIVGGGARDAPEQVRQLAERLQAPVVAHRQGRGVMDDRHPLSIQQPVGNRLWKHVDVAIGIGTRMQQHCMQWGIDDDLKIVRIDIDPLEIRRICRSDAAIVGDAGQAIAALLPHLKSRQQPGHSELAALGDTVAEELDQHVQPQVSYLKAIRAAAPENTILVDEFTQVGYLARVAWPTYRPRQLITSGYQGTLGYGYATALGVKVACPDKPVISLNGDGGFLFNAQEMATAVRENLPVIAIVFDDGAYGNVKRMQKQLYDGRVIASDLTNPDFVAMAESFGVRAWRAEDPAAVGAAIGKALDHNGPSLIHAPVGEMPEPWTHVIPGRVRGRSAM